MTLTKFLLARIAEDEAVVVELRERSARYSNLPRIDHLKWEARARRIDVECQAKRLIVDDVERFRAMIPDRVIGDGDEREAVIVEWADGSVLTALALPYADHPDYDEGWRP